jgi:hypothetical protein
MAFLMARESAAFFFGAGFLQLWKRKAEETKIWAIVLAGRLKMTIDDN